MPSPLTVVQERHHRRLKSRRSARQRGERLVLGAGFLLSAVIILALLAAALAYAGLTRGLPPLAELETLLNAQGGLLLQPTRLYDRTGAHLLATLSPGGAERKYIPYSQLPASLVNATIAASQPGFWSSPGYKLSGWRDASAHPTLAQQLAYELLLWDSPAGVYRAIHERMLAGQMTSAYGREKVLEWYLNSADYGHYAYGAEAAAQFYLGKPAARLDLGESALLAAISQAPALNPLDAPGGFEARRAEVLRAMMAQGLATPAEVSASIQSPPVLAPHTASADPLDSSAAPAFLRLALAQLEPLFGASRLSRGGLDILTSLDYDLQLQAACTLRAALGDLAGSPSPQTNECEAARLLTGYPGAASAADASASALILDPQTGEVLAAVGDLHGGSQAGSLLPHAAGTSVSPFLYLTAFSRGFNPASLAWDVPAASAQPGEIYHGPVRLRIALANDYLAPARSLLDDLSQESVRVTALSFGLQVPSGVRLLRDDFPLSPLQLAQAYGILANSGVQAGQPQGANLLAPSVILKVTGVDHSTWLDRQKPQERSIMSAQLAYLMNQVLSDETARWASLGHPNPLEIGRPAGARLSLALDGSGAWALGYTPQRLAVVWIGANSPNQAASEAFPASAASAWHALMQYSLRDLPSQGWQRPAGLVDVSVCDPSGMLPTADCPNVVTETFLDGRQPVQADTLYQSVEVNIETGLLATVFTPPELVERRTYLVFPPKAREWAKSAGLAVPPAAYDTVDEPVRLPEAHISAPSLFADVRGVVQVVGTAAGADFRSYRLEYGRGLYPSAWVLLGADSPAQVTEGLLGEWDTAGLEGLYALRLMVVRTDARVEQAVIQVTIDNTPPQVAITYPQEGQVIEFVQGAQLALQAQAGDPFLAKVEFLVDGKLIGQSAGAPYGVLWDLRKGGHTLKVVASDSAGNSAETSLQFSVK